MVKVKAGARGVQSVAVGVGLLRALARENGPLPLKVLAEHAGMASAKAHRYLASYISVGLVAKQPGTGHYDLGVLALDIGLAAMRRLDVIKVAAPLLDELRQELGHAVSMAVWGSQGATVVRWCDSRVPISIRIDVGSVLPVATSSSGLMFLANFPIERTDRLLAEARAANPDGLFPDAADLERIRRSGISVVDGLVMPGICSLSAPIRDHQGSIVAALSVVGITGTLDIAVDGPPARLLKAMALRISHGIGYA